MRAVARTSSFAELSASTSAQAKTLVVVFSSVASANGSVDFGTHGTLLHGRLSHQLLPLTALRSDNWNDSHLSGLSILSSLLLVEHSVDVVLDEFDFELSLDVVFFASSEVHELVVVAVDAAQVFVSDSFFAANRHVSVRAILATQFERRTVAV